MEFGACSELLFRELAPGAVPDLKHAPIGVFAFGNAVGFIGTLALRGRVDVVVLVPAASAQGTLGGVVDGASHGARLYSSDKGVQGARRGPMRVDVGMAFGDSRLEEPHEG